MLLNIDNFLKVLMKSTLNFSIETVQLKFNGNKLISKMISGDRSSIVMLDIENDVLPNLMDEVEFNFSEPSQQLVPFLKLIDEETADIDLHSEKIVIKNGRQRSNIHFCSPTVVSVFGTDARDVDYFLEMDLDTDFKESFAKIKKIGGRFGKIYFNMKDKKFTIETTDKTNRFSNGLKFQLAEIASEINDLTICFDFKNFVNLMNVMDIEDSSFRLHFAYMEEQELGMLFAESEDSSEKYFLMSREI